MFQAAEAVSIAGISKHQLREWTGRRGILVADIPGRGRGRHALYSWSTVLVLRVLAELRTRFRIEVGCYGELLTRLRDELAKRSVVGLHGQTLLIQSPKEYRIVAFKPEEVPVAALIVQLDAHVVAIAELVGEEIPRQRPLFPVVSL